MFSFNCTILDDQSTGEVCDLLSLPRTAGNIQAAQRGYDIFKRNLVSFSHTNPPDERLYLVRSQGIWQETHKNTYRTSVNGSFLHCTCPQHRHLAQLLFERHPDLQTTLEAEVICKHGVAVMLHELYERERNAFSGSFPPSHPSPCRFQPTRICYCSDPRFCLRVNNNPREAVLPSSFRKTALLEEEGEAPVRDSVMARSEDERTYLQWRETR